MKLSYDKWKTSDPDTEFLGDNQQAGERREGVMSEEERMAELEGDIVENEKWIQRVEAENHELRQLNAELLGALWAVKAEIMEPQVTEATWIKVETAIAKAEKLK
jgi:hypothetical protein